MRIRRLERGRCAVRFGVCSLIYKNLKFRIDKEEMTSLPLSIRADLI